MTERGPNAEKVEAYLNLPGAFEALGDDARRLLRRGGMRSRRVSVDVNGSGPDDAVQEAVRRSLASPTPFDGDAGVLLRLNLKRVILDSGRAARRTSAVKAGALAGAALRLQLAAGTRRTATAASSDGVPPPVPAWVSLDSAPTASAAPVLLHALDAILPWPSGPKIFRGSNASQGVEDMRILRDLVEKPWATAAEIDLLVRAPEPGYTAALADGGAVRAHCYVGEGSDRRFRLTAVAAVLVVNELLTWRDQLAPTLGHDEALAVVRGAAEYLLKQRTLTLLLTKQLRGETPTVVVKAAANKRLRTTIRAFARADHIIRELLQQVQVPAPPDPAPPTGEHP